MVLSNGPLRRRTRIIPELQKLLFGRYCQVILQEKTTGGKNTRAQRNYQEGVTLVGSLLCFWWKGSRVHVISLQTLLCFIRPLKRGRESPEIKRCKEVRVFGNRGDSPPRTGHNTKEGEGLVDSVSAGGKWDFQWDNPKKGPHRTCRGMGKCPIRPMTRVFAAWGHSYQAGGRRPIERGGVPIAVP